MSRQSSWKAGRSQQPVTRFDEIEEDLNALRHKHNRENLAQSADLDDVEAVADEALAAVNGALLSQTLTMEQLAKGFLARLDVIILHLQIINDGEIPLKDSPFGQFDAIIKHFEYITERQFPVQE